MSRRPAKMSSATGVAETQPVSEEEPLLGRPGDAAQQKGKGIQFNLIIGTAVIAQAGTLILFALIWAAVFTHPVILFSAHPLLNSAGILLIIEGILILQPTHTKEQKQIGTNIHAVLNGLGIATLIAALIIIEYNKISHGGTHFVSPHAILGIITYIWFFLQAIIGIAQYYLPDLFGGVSNAKKLYKYHRISGYVLVVLVLATVAAATKTDYNVSTLGIQLWAVIVLAILILVGLVPRIKKQKLGF